MTKHLNFGHVSFLSCWGHKPHDGWNPARSQGGPGEGQNMILSHPLAAKPAAEPAFPAPPNGGLHSFPHGGSATNALPVNLPGQRATEASGPGHFLHPFHAFGIHDA